MGRILDWLTGAPPADSVTELEREAETYEAHEWMALHPDLDDFTNPISPKVAMTIAALYRGVKIKSGLVTGIPFRAEIAGQFVDETPAIIAQPDPMELQATTLSRLLTSLVFHGEIVAVLGDFEAGYPRVVKVVDPPAASLHDGQWTIAGKPYARDEVLHHIPFALPGWTRGVGVIGLHRRIVQGEIRQTDYQRAFYRDAGMPAVTIKSGRADAGVDEMRELQAWWDAQLRGRRKAIVVGQEEITALKLTNEDMQFIQTREFSLGEIADMVGLPGYYLRAGQSGMTYSNAQEERRSLIDLYLREDLQAIGDAFTSITPDGVTAKFDPSGFLALDPKAQVEFIAAQTWLDDNEKRAAMGLPPRPTPEPTTTEDDHQEITQA